MKQSVAICFPGNSFCSDWVFEFGKILAYCWSKNIGAIICPAVANSTHIARTYCLMAAESTHINYDYAFWIDSDQLEGMNAFQELHIAMECNPEIDILAAWSWIQGNEGTECKINAGMMERDTKGSYTVENGIYKFSYLTLEEIEKATEPIEVDWVGFGCIMIRKKVLDAIGEDIFKPIYKGDVVSDDTGFCIRAHDLGYKVYVHPDVNVPHLKLRSIGPNKR